MKLKHVKEDLRFLKALNSPFKPFKLKWYAGKIAIGTPYFLPRKWVKFTYDDVLDKARDMLDKQTNAVDSGLTKKTFAEWIEYYKGFKKPIPRKFGFDFVRLGWKTKWKETDYRFEWAPMLSFVFFKWQIAVMVQAPEQDQYWEAWLYYEYSTDKRLPKWIRIRQCREKFPLLWTVYHKDPKTGDNTGKETVDYYNHILKPKYLK